MAESTIAYELSQSNNRVCMAHNCQMRIAHDSDTTTTIDSSDRIINCAHTNNRTAHISAFVEISRDSAEYICSHGTMKIIFLHENWEMLERLIELSTLLPFIHSSSFDWQCKPPMMRMQAADVMQQAAHK